MDNLEISTNTIKIKSFPFYTGLVTNPFPEKLPINLPIGLYFDQHNGLVRQISNNNVDKYNEIAYKQGSSLSTPLGTGTFGEIWANDVLNALEIALEKKSFTGLNILEIGCGNGYLLTQVSHKAI